MDRTFGLIGVGLGFLAVAFGAFGAHALKARLEPADLEIFETAVRYQMYHALAILFVAMLLGRAGAPGGAEVAADPLLNWAGWSFTLGVLVFSGSLYLLVLTGARWMGAITPIGGLALLAGWALLALSIWRGA